MTDFLYANLPKKQADDFWLNLQSILGGTVGGPLVRILGLGTALWAAAGGMSMTISALDRVYSLPATGSRPFWKQRLIALGLTFIVAALIVAVLVLLPIGSIAKEWVVSLGVIPEEHPLLTLFEIARWVLALLFMITLLMVLYHFGPNVTHRFRWITPGAIFSIVVWIVLGLAFRYYVTRYGKFDKTYGSVAGVAIMLLVFYIDAVVLLLGAEINSEIDFEVLKIQRGTRDFRPAETAVDAGEKDPAAAIDTWGV